MTKGTPRIGWGCPPGQVVDFLALVGDASDNIPGVKGIGEKGAQKLLAEFGDLETILARAGEVTAKRTREALLTQADSALLSRELVTIKRDVPVELDAGALVPHEPDREAVIRLLTELEFFSLARKLTGQGGSASVEQSVASVAAREEGERSVERPDASLATLTEEEEESSFSAESWLTLSDLSGPSSTTVTVLDDPDDLPALIERLRAAPIVGLDTEASSPEPHDAELIGLSLAASPEEVWYLPFGHRPGGGELAAPTPVRNLPPLTDPSNAALYALLTDSAVPKAGHDIKFDWQVLRRAGVELAGVAYDSMLASFVLDPGTALPCHRHTLSRAPRPSHADLSGAGGQGKVGDPVCRGGRSSGCELLRRG